MAPISTVLPLLLALPYASAWGSLGHTTVGYIAQNFVSGKTIKFAQRLLNDTSDNYLASVATWADSYRNEKGGAYSAPYHFIDALDNPPESCSVNFERDCPEEGCIVSAIANYSSRALQQNITLLEQQNALKFIIHFVGDIHQPLHVENLALGGNKINVTFNGAKTNLHSIWDTAIPQKAEGNFSLPNALAWATNLTQEIKHGKFHKESKSWIKGINADDAIDSAMIWASDSNQYVCTTVLPNGPDAVFGQELSGAYYESAIPVVQHQIAKAGYILAHWLDAIVQADLQHKHDVNHPPKNYMLEKRASYQLEPWMVEARAARRADGGDCGCGEKHAH